MTQALDQVRDEQLLTATTSDVLGSTDLSQMPGPGAVAVWVASDQNDSSVTIRLNQRQAISGGLIPNKGTNAPIEENQQAPVAMFQVRGGEKLRIDVVEVTAANIRVITVWAGRSL